MTQFDELFELLELSDGNARWKALQKWLKKNKVAKSHVNECLALPASGAVDYLAKQFGLPAATIRVLVPNHPMIAKADGAMEVIQKLYKERAALDKKPTRKKVGSKKPTEETV